MQVRLLLLLAAPLVGLVWMRALQRPPAPVESAAEPTAAAPLGESGVTLQTVTLEAPGNATWLEEHRRRRGEQDPRIELRLETGDGRRTYRLGEPISLRLAFVAREPGWRIRGTWDDLEDRDAREVVHVERRADVTDMQLPLSDDWWDSRRPFAIIGSHWKRPPPQTELPVGEEVVRTLRFNPRLRFDRAGRHSLYVETRRFLLADSSFGAVSDVLELNFLPRDRGWEQRQLARATRERDVRALARLDTAESTRVLASWYLARELAREEALWWVSRSSHPRVALEVISAGLSAPRQAIHREDISLLVNLECRIRRIPDYVMQPSDSQFFAVVDATFQRLYEAVQEKPPAVQARCALAVGARSEESIRAESRSE